MTVLLLVQNIADVHGYICWELLLEAVVGMPGRIEAGLSLAVRCILASKTTTMLKLELW
jgi:hypothetical protein